MKDYIVFGAYNNKGEFIGYKASSDWKLTSNKNEAVIHGLLSHSEAMDNLLNFLKSCNEKTEKENSNLTKMLNSIQEKGYLKVEVQSWQSGEVRISYKVYKKGRNFTFDSFPMSSYF